MNNKTTNLLPTRIGLVAVVVLTLVSGCQANGLNSTGNSTTNYSIFFDQADHVEELVQAGEIDEAASIYRAEQTYFKDAKVRADVMPALEEIFVYLTAEPLAKIDPAVSTLKAINWPAAQQDWPRVKAALADARTIVGNIPVHPLLQTPEFSTRAKNRFDEFSKTVEDLAADINASATVELSKFDIFDGTDFFSVFPVTLNANKILGEPIAQVANRVATASRENLLAFAETYEDALSGSNKTLFETASNRYMALSLEALAKESDSSTFDIALAALANSKQAGFTPTDLPGLKIGFTDATSYTLLRQGQIEFTPEIEIDLPVQTVGADLESVVEDPDTPSLIIVWQTALAKTSRKVQALVEVPSRRIVGTKQVPNPAYKLAVLNLDTAKLNIQSAQMNSTMASLQTGLAGAFSQLAASFKLGSAKDSYTEAVKAVANTPETNTVDVYGDYTFQTANVVAKKTLTVNYYIVDRDAGTFYRDVFDVVEETAFKIIYRLDKTDVAFKSNMNGKQTESDVVEWEERPATVKLSQMIDHYTANKEGASKIASTQQLFETMLEDRNIALTKYNENIYDARPLNDPRFDSVVVIYNKTSGGLGSGFFIRPDVVITNQHVVRDAKFVEMKTYDGQETFGKILTTDARLDLALIKVQSRGKPVKIYRGKTLDLGATVDVIGHPKGLEFSVTRGIISAIRREQSVVTGSAGKLVLFVQTDAAVNPGNSGGPMFLGDEVIAIQSWGLVGAEALNFSIHYSEMLTFIEESLGPSS